MASYVAVKLYGPGHVVACNYVLPTVTDGFTGTAPDLGALEVGRPAPYYGPRPR